jgi:outer membrane protein OmpA-like peptidoglycan-associated protein
MTHRIALATALAGSLALTACVTTDPVTGEPSRTQAGALTGALIGGALGAATGDDGDNRLGRAVVGAGLGAIVGGAIGYNLDQQAAELRGQLGNNVQIINEGTQLRVVMPQDILFATDSATLQPALVRDLQAVAQSLLNYPASSVQVIGHTDNVGAAAYNQDLSQRRARSVAAVLVDYGVPGGRIAAFGRGEDAPVASNLTPEGRAQNRRVEILIIPTTR